MANGAKEDQLLVHRDSRRDNECGSVVEDCGGEVWIAAWSDGVDGVKDRGCLKREEKGNRAKRIEWRAQGGK